MKRYIPFLICIGIFLVFYIVYFYLGFLLYQTGVFSKFDVLFESDVPRVIEDMTNYESDHYRSSVHPLFVLITNPIGILLGKIISNRTAIAIGINSFFGALGVVLSFFFFWLQSKDVIYSFLFSSLFGLSMSQLFWSSVPETYSLGVCTLLLTYILFAYDNEQEVIHRRLWILSGVLTVGVATTNFIQALMFYIFRSTKISKKQGGLGANLFIIVGFIFNVAVISIALAAIQQQIYPSAELFFIPKSLTYELRYGDWIIFKDPLKVIGQILKNFFIVNMIAPIPDSYYYVFYRITFSGSWNYLWIGWTAITVWIALLVIGFVKGFFLKSKDLSFCIAIGLCLLFEALLHSYYGWRVDGSSELFLYSGYFTFLTMIVISWTFRNPGVYSKIVLGVLCILTGLNNTMVFQNIIAHYR